MGGRLRKVGEKKTRASLGKRNGEETHVYSFEMSKNNFIFRGQKGSCIRQKCWAAAREPLKLKKTEFIKGCRRV